MSNDTQPDTAGIDAPRLLDLYCCQGGASMGYHRAGFVVVGVDLNSQPRYPFAFSKTNALELLTWLIEGGFHNFGTGPLYLSDFHAIHASPPCQAHTLAQRIQGNAHADLIEPTRFLLETTGLPYVIENVPGSPLLDPIELCGSMFGLRTYRHRLFESNAPLTSPDHPEHTVRTTKMGRPVREGEFMHVVGNFAGADLAREVMEMPWASRDGLREAIPPAYTEHIGRQVMAHLEAQGAAA